MALDEESIEKGGKDLSYGGMSELECAEIRQMTKGRAKRLLCEYVDDVGRLHNPLFVTKLIDPECRGFVEVETFIRDATEKLARLIGDGWPGVLWYSEAQRQITAFGNNGIH